MGGTSEGAKKAAQTRKNRSSGNRLQVDKKTEKNRGYESVSRAKKKGSERSHGGR